MRFLILLLSLAFASSERETHRLIKVQFGVDVAQDIVHEKDENTVTVTVSQTPGLKNLIPTVNYHDFNTKYVAFKDIERGRCFLTLAPIPRATPEIYRMKRTNETLAYTANFDKVPLSGAQVEVYAGKKVRDFCQDYMTLRMSLIPTSEASIYRRATTDEDPEPCWFNCGRCFVDASRLLDQPTTFG